LIQELRHLTHLTQVQLAETLGVTYETINRWENGRVQPLPLALRQIRSIVDQLTQSPSKVLHEGGRALLTNIFQGRKDVDGR